MAPVDPGQTRAGLMPEAGTRALLDALLDGDQQQTLDFSDLMHGLGRRAFGMLLFMATLPAFIPIPIGGALSGPLVVLLGAQLLIGLHKPWLPGIIARRGPKRETLARFEQILAPWLLRLERLVRPRLADILDHRLASAFTGLLLVILGLLLSLPIPFTNYLLGGLILLFALALPERDGVLMLVVWAAGIIAIATTGALSGELVTAMHPLLGRIF